MLKDSTKILIHKLSVVQLLVVYKPIHKTSKFDSFNHHQSHHQVHSSSRKCDHLNHPHHHHFASVNKLHHSLNHLHSSSVKDHQHHQHHLLHKQSFVVYQLYQFHHDQSSLNVFHRSHLDHVISSLNDGSHTELKLNERPLFNVLLPLLDMPSHATSSFNMNQFKFVLFVNSNASVLYNITHKLTFNNMVLNFLMLKLFSNKLVLLVLLKISHLQLLLQLLVSLPVHLAQK
jgi:hypothetical protein